MKKACLSVILATIVVFTTNAQIVNITDPVLKNYLLNHSYSTNPTGIGTQVYLDSNFDGDVQYSEAASYTSNIYDHGFNISGLGIVDLTGMESFTSIQSLNATNNQITSFDLVSGCSSLKSLSASDNPITSFSITNLSLENIDFSNCSTLPSLVLSGCPALKKFTCQQNQGLTSLNLTGCVNLQELRVNNNSMLTALNMSNHWSLTLFQCSNNALTTLDVSGCPILQYLFCTGNQLQSLNLANGHPQSFMQILASGHPALTCVKVDNVAVSQFLWAVNPYVFDAWANFNTNCTPTGPCIVSIPDANFKAKLLANSAINTNTNNEIECAEAQAYSGAINVDSADISDMTGIEAFVNITTLSLNNNNVWNLDSLNVSNFTSLTTISCTGNNHFKYLNASGCTSLTSFYVSTGIFAGLSINVNSCTSLTNLNLANKELNYLNVSGCSYLTTLVCNNNYLTTLDLNDCSTLTTLTCNDNQITSLDLSHSPLLTNINCSNNQLASLFTFGNPNLSLLDCSDNQLPILIVSANTALTNLNCSYNNLSYLDVNNNAVLSILNCSYNNLASIQANNNFMLTLLDCNSNSLNTLNVSVDTSLIQLNSSNNNLSTVNVNNNKKLQNFSCVNNNLTNIDLSHNIDLKILDCSYNQLSNLDLSNNSMLFQVTCSNNQLTVLDLQNDSNLILLHCTHNQLTDLDLSNTKFLMLKCDSNQLATLNLANGFNMNTMMISANNNSQLECVQVDNATYSNTNWTGTLFLFDSGVTFNGNCLSIITGISEPTKNKSFTVYPNPTNGMVYFPEQTTVQVTNAMGQAIINRKNVNTIDLSTHAAGVYFITFTDTDDRIIQRGKIVKE